MRKTYNFGIVSIPAAGVWIAGALFAAFGLAAIDTGAFNAATNNAAAIVKTQPKQSDYILANLPGDLQYMKDSTFTIQGVRVKVIGLVTQPTGD